MEKYVVIRDGRIVAECLEEDDARAIVDANGGEVLRWEAVPR